MLSMRAPSMLPSIKCSNCGDEIEITMLGDHQCGPSRRNQAPLPPVPAMPQGGRQPDPRVQSSYFFSPSQISQSNSKPSKALPPKIDASAANRPYARKDVYAANDAYTTQAPAPAPRGGPIENRPSRQQRNPSEHLAPNLDSPFPSFPASPAVKTPPSGFSSPLFFAGLQPAAPAPPAASEKPSTLAPPPHNQPRSMPSPTTQMEPDLSSPNFFAGLKALAPPQSQTRPASQGIKNDRDEAKRNQFFGKKESNPRQNGVVQNNYSSYGTKQLVPVAKPDRNDKPAAKPAAKVEKPESTPSRPTRAGGEVDNFIASLKDDAKRPNRANAVGLRPTMSRSDSRAKNSPLSGLERSPSQPLRQPFVREPARAPERSATTNNLQDSSYTNYPTRSSSRSGSQNPARVSEELPLPAMAYGDSAYSGHYSSNSNSSSGSSSMSRDSAFTGGLSTPPSDVSLVSSSNFAKSSPPRAYDSQLNGAGGNPYTNPYNPYNPYALEEEEPQRAQQKSWVPPAKPYTSSPANDYSAEVGMYSAPSRNNAPAPRFNPFSSRTDPNDMTERPMLLRSATESSMASVTSMRPRHSCRGCKQPISGKSIKASDGRLSGRYHRSCFVCTTCRAPFASAQVYVMHDAPYCEYHYHALNGSLCASCDTGIEGEYRETEKRDKFHTRCLTCRTCRQVLSDEYFEVNKDVYCERHAMAEVRRLGQAGSMGGDGGYGGGPNQGGGLAPGSWKAERRKTRLGMM